MIPHLSVRRMQVWHCDIKSLKSNEAAYNMDLQGKFFEIRVPGFAYVIAHLAY